MCLCFSYINNDDVDKNHEKAAKYRNEHVFPADKISQEPIDRQRAKQSAPPRNRSGGEVKMLQVMVFHSEKVCFRWVLCRCLDIIV